MPHRNLLALCFAATAALVCWAARDHSPHGRRFGDILDRIDASYIHPVDSNMLFEAAVDGMLGKLDEHSGYVRPSDRAVVEASLDQEFGGIGLEFSAGSPQGHPVVRVVRAESPAMRAGISPGDRILSIDGRSTRGLALPDIIGMVRGRVGTRITVTVLGPGSDSSVAEVRSLELQRETILVETVLGDRRDASGTWNFRLEGRPSIGLVRIVSFGERTADEVTNAIAALTDDAEAGVPLDGLVIDLRGNSGGLLSAAVTVCDLFIGDRSAEPVADAVPTVEPRLIVSTRARDGRSGRGVVERRVAGTGDLLPGLPLAVLVDAGTASAAEIVAACLQDHGRAVIVGGRTFGKGTIQQLLPLESGGLLKLTTSQFFRPNGRPIHRPSPVPPAVEGASVVESASSRPLVSEWGVTPDDGCVVEPPLDAVLRLASWRERREAAPVTASVAATDIGESSASELPERVDAVLARAIEAIGAQR